MTDFYVLKRRPRSVDWTVVWLWVALVVFGLTELGFAVYGFWHAGRVFLERMGLL